jgi:hypothetical protein
MDQQLSRRAGCVLGLLWLGFFSVAFAQAPTQTPAQASPPLFSRVGVIGTLDLPLGSITVNDFRYQLSPNVHVYVYDRSIKDPQALRADTRLKDGRALRTGMYIGYTVEGEAGGKRGTLTEAWILPPGSLPELEKGVKSKESSVTKGTDKAQPAR